LRQGIGIDVPFRPMVRGRLVAVNDAELDTKKFGDIRARRLANANSICHGPMHCRRVIRSRAASSGGWNTSSDAGMSLEEGIAETLGVKLGDALTFDIAGSKVTAKVTSLRKVDWDSFRVNFFALVSARAARHHAGHLYLGVSRPGVQQRVVPALVQKYPNILVIDIGEIVRQVQGIMDSVSRAVNSCSCSRWPAAFWCCRRRSPRRRTSASSTPRSCARLEHRSGNW